VTGFDPELLLAETGALLNGHFILSSGRHSDVFVQKFRLFENPGPTQLCGRELALRFEGAFDVVASPAVGALILGWSTALAAGTRSVFAERVDGRMAFRRGFRLEPGERVLVVEDVVTTGGSAREVLDLVGGAGAAPAGVGALVDRSDSGLPPSFGVPLEALVRLEATSWDAESCPLCRSGAPLEDPGSRRLPQGGG
jgi:orotate phosphoribosyltransferase